MTDDELDDLGYSPEYAEFIMANAGDTKVITNGNALLVAMEEGFLFQEFLQHKPA